MGNQDYLIPSYSEIIDEDYFIVPKWLSSKPFTIKIQPETILLYSYLLDRVRGAIEITDKVNNFKDEEGNFFVYATNQELMRGYDFSNKEVQNSFNQLKQIGLVKIVPQGQGTPFKVYVHLLDENKQPYPIKNTVTDEELLATGF